MQSNRKVLQKLPLFRWKQLFLTLVCIVPLLTLQNCTNVNSQQQVKETSISENLGWSERMASSIMLRHERAWQIEDRTSKKWSYTHGLVSMSFLHLWKSTGNNKYYDYALGYAEDMVNESGEIYNYTIDEFNIDHINPGKILFDIHEETGEERYKTAMETLRTQLEWQPRNTLGGYWHKLRYPWQMWLDGLYMGAPFYAQYAAENNKDEDFDDIANQFIIMEENARDDQTGLLYHGWDQSTVQRWADDETGLSPHFWGRAMGWYGMGLVDALDFFPEDHPKRKDMVDILQRLVSSMSEYQDEESGLWYQVVNLPDREGNYQEATVSCMMSYIMLKGVRKGYLDSMYQDNGMKAYNGIIDNLIEVKAEGEVHIHKCCAVAGLGGNPYRDGSFEYYVNEQVRSNDPKATGPFILASIEVEMKNKSGE